MRAPGGYVDTDPIVIVSGARTPMGSFNGVFADVTAPDLGASAISEALRRSGVPVGEIADVIMGCVLPAGIGQAPARQAALKAGLPDSVPATTVNKMRLRHEGGDAGRRRAGGAPTGRHRRRRH